MAESDTGLMTISEVAREVGVSAQTLRHWEQEDLVTPQRTAGGQRRYNEGDVARVKQVIAMRQRHGWNTAAIRTSLGKDGDGGSRAPLPLNQRLRRARRALRLTQREAAERIGVPLARLRSIERGEEAPTIQVISRIADTYVLPMSAFAASSKSGRPVVRAGERPRTVNRGGVTWEELCEPGRSLEPAVLVVPPLEDSGGPYSRRGTTFAFVLAGRFGVAVGDPEEGFVLRAGDAITIDPGAVFRWWNPARRETRVLWVEELGAEAWNSGAATRMLGSSHETGKTVP